MNQEPGLNQMLALRDNAKQQLLQIQSVEEGIAYLNKLAAIDVWVKAEKKDAELQNIVAEQKIRTQRILGELIAEGQRKGTIRKQIDTPTTVPSSARSVGDIGLSHKQSSTFQQIAEIPQEDFEEFIKEKKSKVNQAVSELTTSGAVRLAQSLTNKKSNNADFTKNQEHEQEVRQLLERINSLPAYYRLKIKQGIKRC